ncbi:glycosyltransferase [Arthrobacter ginkgonis]|uniref:Glycosyltransferase n=1 Tax=Arthrobacter ginkgonis TaxID=1630594 RepID=A0ABP7BYK8_9MICC
MGNGTDVLVSVVVATYNSPPELDVLVASLDAQTLPAGEWEAIFVDDGSTDGTYPRLEAMAAARPYMRVLRIPNSGWPGRPRNVGTDAARGRYVFYCDHDDYLFPEALERMGRFAAGAGLDALHPKEVVQGWSSPGWNEWRANAAPLARLDDAAVQCITPHKLYRREFLAEHGIRFPEGRIRLEDFSFNGMVWCATEAVGVLADYPCYRWTIHENNSHKAGYDFEVYWRSFEESLQPVLALPDSDPRKDVLLRRWYRSRILERVAGYGRYSTTDRKRFTARFDRLLEHFPERIDAGLQPPERLRSYLLRRGHHVRLLELSRLDAGIRVAPEVRDVRWARGVLQVAVDAILLDGAGAPLPFARRGRNGDEVAGAEGAGGRHAVRADPLAGALFRNLPESIVSGVPEEVLAHYPAAAAVEPVIRSRETDVDWLLQGRSRVDASRLGPALAVRAEVVFELDPETAAYGSRLDGGVWDIFVRITGLGYGATHRVRTTWDPGRPALLNGRSAIPYRTQGGALALDLESFARTAVGSARPRKQDLAQDSAPGEPLVLRLPAVHVSGDTRLAGSVEAGPVGTDGSRAGGNGKVTYPAQLVGERGTARVEISAPAGLDLTESRMRFEDRWSTTLFKPPEA